MTSCQLPPSLTLEKLRLPHGSVPGNPQLAEQLNLTSYIERMGTGTGNMIRRCREAGLPEPEFSVSDGFATIIRRRAGEVTGEVERLILVCHGELDRKALQAALALKSEENFRKLYLVPALAAGLVEMIIPDKPTSRNQKYRLTAKGRVLQNALVSKENP
jgi:hypothetical protein